MAQARRVARLRRTAAGLALALLAASCGGGSDEGSGPAQPQVLESEDPKTGCGAVVRFPSEGASHLDQGEKGSYRTQPPTSGKHAPRWGSTGTHSKAITDEVQVHNLEHGHIVIQYVPGGIDAALLDGLVALANTQPRWILLAPRAPGRFQPAAQLAFTAWRVAQVCS
ncbi:MAG: DUF3105 domain-containing protein, partial [Actinomycetota bacterium]